MRHTLRRQEDFAPATETSGRLQPCGRLSLNAGTQKTKKMKTKSPADGFVNDPRLITVLSLNTHWVARCPVRLPEPLVHAQLRRLLQRGGGEVPGSFGFRAHIALAGASAQIRVSSRQREMFTSGIAWAGDDWAAELWRGLLARSWEMCPSEEPRWVPAPPLPWMVTLYSPFFERLPLAEGVALAVFQRSLSSVLLCRHLPRREAAQLPSSAPSGKSKALTICRTTTRLNSERQNPRE